MALDQREQYRQDAEAMERASNIAAFFSALSEQDGDEAGAEQARRDENTLNRWAALLHQLATTEPDVEPEPGAVTEEGAG